MFEPDAKYPITQGIPTQLKTIIDVLSNSNVPGRRKAASNLLNCASQARDIITNGLNEALRQQYHTRRPLPISTVGEVKITICCWQKGILERNSSFARHHTKVVMMVAVEEERMLLEQIFDKHNQLEEVLPAFVTLKGLSSIELKDLCTEAAKLKENRVVKAISLHGKIGRNEMCPCGSEKKYKLCCGN